MQPFLTRVKACSYPSSEPASSQNDCPILTPEDPADHTVNQRVVVRSTFCHCGLFLVFTSVFPRGSIYQRPYQIRPSWGAQAPLKWALLEHCRIMWGLSLNNAGPYMMVLYNLPRFGNCNLGQLPSEAEFSFWFGWCSHVLLGKCHSCRYGGCQKYLP